MRELNEGELKNISGGFVVSASFIVVLVGVATLSVYFLHEPTSSGENLVLPICEKNTESSHLHLDFQASKYRPLYVTPFIY